MLRRSGLLRSDGAQSWTFNRHGSDEFAVAVVSRLEESVIVLMIVRDDERTVQKVRLSWSACRFGGRRAWLHCPLCGRRVFKLYYYPHTVNAHGEHVHYFACRHCYPTTYQLRNERDKYFWQMKRIGKIQKRLGGSDDYAADFPDKPKWMRWRTYERMVRAVDEACARADEAFISGMARKFP
ncbi:MAG: hypothetical protein ABI874_11040, partial [Chloroflexota bacterium]